MDLVYNAGMSANERKDLHMKQAASYIRYFQDTRDKIYDKDIQNSTDEMIRALRDLRDLQYWFDSGEYELDRFYDKYLPFLNMIFENYLKLESSWNFEELKKVKEKLIKTIGQVIDVIQQIMKILPMDEMSDASAEIKAKQAKEELDRKYSRLENL